MNAQGLIRLAIGRKGILSNLESIVGAAFAGAGILALQHFGYVLTEQRMGAILAGGIVAGNQLLGNLDIFRRLDKLVFPETPTEGPGA